MDDELEWLREAATQLPELDEGSLRRARERLFAEISPRVALRHDESLLDDLPIEGLADDDVGGSRPVGGRAAVLGSIAAVAALVAGIAVVVQGSDNETSLDDAVGDQATDPIVDAGADDSPVGVLDGTDEITLIPLELSDHAPLADGQFITVNGYGFASNRSVWVVQCSRPSTATTILAGCDLATAQHSRVAEDGSLGVDIRASRFIHVDGIDVDCSVSDCAISVALTVDYRHHGTIALSFDATASPAAAPDLVVDVTTGLIDGQALKVTGSGFDPSSEVRLVQCVIGVIETTPNCFQRWKMDPLASRPGQRQTTDSEGRFEATIFADRLVRTLNDQIDCADPRSGRCMVAVIPIDDTLISSQILLAAQPLFFDGRFDPPTLGVAIEPASGFVDGDSVTITVAGARYPEIRLCMVGRDDGCIALVTGDGVQRGSTFSVELVLPRIFDTWEGRNHDCIDDGPCELRIEASGFPPDPLPLVYDAEAPLSDPVAVTSRPEGPHVPGDRLTITVAPSRSLLLRQCISAIPADGRTSDYCDSGNRIYYDEGREVDETSSTGSFVNDDGRLQFEIEVYRRLFLPNGEIHDCVTDGACHLLMTAPLDITRYSPVPLEFDPRYLPLGVPSVVMSQALDLIDGQIITLSVSNVAQASTIDIQLCRQETLLTTRCPSIEQHQLDGSDSVTYRTSIPRWTTSPTGALWDCAQSCALRVTTGRTSAYVLVSFDADSEFRALATLRIDPVTAASGDGIAVVGEGFPPGSPTSSPLDTYLCESSPTNLASVISRVRGCGAPEQPIWEEAPVIDPDGRFTGVLRMPDGFELYGSGAGVSCVTGSCWLLVATSSQDAGFALAAVQLPVG